MCESDSRTRRDITPIVMPDIAIARTCASKSAVKREFGRTSYGIRTVGGCSYSFVKLESA